MVVKKFMKILKTKFKDLVVIKKDTFKDSRGYFKELFAQKLFKKKFVFDVMSFSKKNVIRGLHLQLNKQQGKYITILQGKVLDVALDLRKRSKTFGKVFKIVLSSENNTSVYIPPGFAHGFCSLSNNSLMHYKCTNYRDKSSETGIIWNDNDLKIKWPTNNPIISKKDQKLNNYKDFKKK